MRDFLVWWIVVQLVCIGAAIVNAENEVIEGRFDCTPHVHSEWLGAAFPLAFFVPEPSELTKYCADKNGGKP